MTRTGLVIVHFSKKNRPDTTECLTSLSQVEDIKNLRIYLVNHEPNFSLKKEFPWVEEIEEADNVGFSGFHNLGIKQALKDNCTYIGLLNNDTTVEKDFLLPLIKTLQNRKVGAVSPKIHFYPGREFHHESYSKKELGSVIWYAGGEIDWRNMYAYHWGVDEVDHGQFSREQSTDFATGCMLITRAEVFKKVGLLNERYFLYWEDVDWSQRVKQAGYQILLQPKSLIYHKNAGTTGGSGSKLHQYYQTRNRLLFGYKYAPFKTKIALLREAYGKLQTGSQAEKQAIRDALTLRFGRRYS